MRSPSKEAIINCPVSHHLSAHRMQPPDNAYVPSHPYGPCHEECHQTNYEADQNTRDMVRVLEHQEGESKDKEYHAGVPMVLHVEECKGFDNDTPPKEECVRHAVDDGHGLCPKHRMRHSCHKDNLHHGERDASTGWINVRHPLQSPPCEYDFDALEAIRQ